MQQTPLASVYEAHGGKVVDFHGWAMPVQFSGIVQEHLHTRAKAGLYDCSHMGEFYVRGAAAIEALDYLVFSSFKELKVGRCRYSGILNEQGGLVDDCVAVRLDAETIYLVTNAGALDELEALLANAVPGIENVSAATAKLDIQGPASRDILLDLGFECVRGMKFWACVQSRWLDYDIIIARAGYTGELGYELYVPAAAAIPLWEECVGHDGVLPCGLGARDTLRTEVGYPLSGQDFSEEISPLEAGMGRFIAWDKDFKGKAALLAQREQGGYGELTAIQSPTRRAPRHGFEVKHEGQVVGVVTSGTFGPSVERGVGLARVPRELAVPGTPLTAGPKDMPIETAEIPVYKLGTARMKVE